MLHTAVLEHWAVFADEVRPILAVSTLADSTFHIAFHRNKDVLRRYPTLLKLYRGEAHHDLGATDHGYCVQRIKRRPGDESCDDTDTTTPLACSIIYRDIHLKVKVRTPVLDFTAIEDVFRCTSTVEEHDLAVLFPLGDDLVHGRTKGGKSDPTGDNHDILAQGTLDGPVTAERPAHTYHVFRL